VERVGDAMDDVFWGLLAAGLDVAEVGVAHQALGGELGSRSVLSLADGSDRLPECNALSHIRKGRKSLPVSSSVTRKRDERSR
jgi:hypothetical protein